MPWCVVVGCKNNLKATKRSGKDLSFHIFPKNPQRRNAWIKTLNRPFKFNADSSYICSEHFIPDDFESNSLKEELLNIKIKRQLKKSAVPSVNIPTPLEEKQCEVSVDNFNCQIPIEDNINSIILIKEEMEDPEKNVEDEEIKIIDVKMVQDEFIKKERKKLVDKLLADYEEQQNNKSHLKGMITKYPSFFSPKINPNTKLGDKLRLLKAIENPKTYSPTKKRRISPPSNSNTEILETPSNTSTSLNTNQIIQVSAVKGGLMLHALPVPADHLQSNQFENNITDEEEEIIIVTEDEASHVDLSSYEEKHKENNTEVIIVTNLKETEDTFKHLENVPKKCKTKINDSNKKCCVQNNLKKNDDKFTPMHTDKVQLTEEKACQVLIPCKGCEHRSLKINKLLRERTRLLKDHNQNGAWKDPDEITALRRMNGVLSLLLKQCVSEKYGRKSSSIRVDLVQDSIERIDRGWSMQDTSEALCQAFSVNAYDTFSRAFEILNET